MKQLLNLDELPKVEKEIMEFLLDEYYSLEDGAETTSEDSFVIHYRDQTGYIINNIERIIKYNKPQKSNDVNSISITQQKMDSLIELLKQEYYHGSDSIITDTNGVTYKQNVKNEVKYLVSAICIILGIKIPEGEREF